MALKDLNNYSGCKNKLRTLWEAVKELEGLENRLKKRIEKLEIEISHARKEIEEEN